MTGQQYFDRMNDAASDGNSGLWRRYTQSAVDGACLVCWQQNEVGNTVPWHVHFNDGWIELAVKGDLARFRWRETVPNYAGGKRCVIAPAA